MERINALFRKFQSCWARESLPTKEDVVVAAAAPAPPHAHAQDGPVGQTRGTSHHHPAQQQQQQPARARAKEEEPVSDDAGAREAGAGPASGAAKAEAATRSTWGMAAMGMEEAESIYGSVSSDGRPPSGVQQAASLVRAVGKIADATEEVMPRV